MAFPTTSVLDDFNRADEDPLSQGGAWTSIAEVGGMEIISLQASPTLNFAGSYRGSYADVEVFVTLSTFVAAIAETSITTRYQDAGGASPIRDSRRRGYQFTANETAYSFTRMDDGATGSALIASTAWPGGNIADGDAIGLSSIGSAHVLYLSRGGGAYTQINTATDGTYTNAGAIMFQGSAQFDARYDNFGGGVAVVATHTPRTMPMTSRGTSW